MQYLPYGSILKGEIIIVDPKKLFKISNKNLNAYYHALELTGEWLINLGFEAVPDKETGGRKNQFQILIMQSAARYLRVYVAASILASVVESETEVSVNLIKYVHEIQNIYFVLTGKELTI